MADLHLATGAWYLGAAARYLALLVDVLGRHDEADTLFARADSEHEEMHSPPWMARNKLDWADSLLRRGRTTEALELADAALRAIGELELDASRKRAEQILERRR